MKRYAAHRVCDVSNLTMLRNYVVEIEEETHSVVQLFELKEEIRFTEWKGGMILLCNELPIRKEQENFADFILRLRANEQDRVQTSLYAYHITSFDVSAMEFTKNSRIVSL